MTSITSVYGSSYPPSPENEPVWSYEPGTKERSDLSGLLHSLRSEVKDIPMYIGGEAIRTDQQIPIFAPHDHQHLLAHFHEGDKDHVHLAIRSALQARHLWAEMSWEDRASIFLRAAELLAGPYRLEINARTMLGQSKNVFQAEVDAACELIDFLRFNVTFMRELYEEQPISAAGFWNRVEYRPLEGFVFAITPFNFTSIAANLACAPALMGNTVVWKPAYPQIYSAEVIMKTLEEAGLPPGVINLIYVDGPVAGDIVFSHPDFAGLHFTGSTSVFRELWKKTGENVHLYRNYPRIVGETGGKDFVVAHPSADTSALSVALTRGAFEYQGQKCSAASRLYVADSIWSELEGRLLEHLEEIEMGSVEDFAKFINAVISQQSFDRIQAHLHRLSDDKHAEIIFGGRCDDSKGYFIEPTVVVVTDPKHWLLSEEIFGPVLAVYVYPEKAYEKTLTLINNTSPYGLTGAVFAQDQEAISVAMDRLRYAAGNFYINDKPTGAVVGQQPFGGARASGTNDKAGSVFNLLRWVSPRTIKETFVPPKDYIYPFMK